jgi:hypothetical protein
LAFSCCFRLLYSTSKTFPNEELSECTVVFEHCLPTFLTGGFLGRAETISG